MVLKTPLKSVYDNLMFTNKGDMFAYYKIMPKSINTHNKVEKENLKERHKMFIERLVKYKDFHFEMCPRQIDLKERFNDLEEDFATDIGNVPKHYTDRTVSLLEKEFGLVTEEAYYIGVKLKDTLFSDDMKEAVVKGAENIADKLLSFMGYTVKEDREFFESFKPLEEDLFQIITSIDGVRVSEDEMIYLNRMNFIRDIHHSVENEKSNRDVNSITDTIIDPSEPGFLKLLTAEGQSYISMIPVSKTRSNIAYLHLYELASELPFPVELHIKGQFQDLDKVNGKVSRLKTRFKQTKKETNNTGDSESRKNKEGRKILTRLEEDIEEKVPFINWLACFVVTGKTKKECKRKGDSLMRILDSRKIKGTRPLADQLQLFYKMLHGEVLESKDVNWIQRTNPTAFAENLFATTSRLGNEVGFVLGRVDNRKTSRDLESSIRSSRKLVMFHPFIANKGIKGAKTDSPHIAITGETGKGKSYLTKLIFMYLVLINTRILYIDPKKEMKKWFSKAVNDPYINEHFPHFVEMMKKFYYVTLDVSDEKNWGALDPISFLKGTEARDTAESMIEQIYSTKGKDAVKTAILKSINAVILRKELGEKVGMLHVIELLREHEKEEVKDAGELLFELVNKSILQLGFGDGTNAGVSLKERVTILEISGLSLPKEEDLPADYSEDEKKSVCLMLPLGKFCEKFGAENPDENTAEIFDEAWILTVAKGGKKVLKNMKRVGRSQNNMLVYTTQSVADVRSEDDRGQFGTVFAFDEPSERSDILQHMNIEDTKDNQAWLAGMIKGQCLYKDIYGRVGKINVHCMFREWDLAFKTIDKTASSRAEEKYAS